MKDFMLFCIVLASVLGVISSILNNGFGNHAPKSKNIFYFLFVDRY